jgi:ligand-binding sensor domain-containing protein
MRQHRSLPMMRSLETAVLSIGTSSGNLIGLANALSAVNNLDFNDQSHVFFAVATPASPFQPILTSSPSDWSLSLNYTSGGGLSNASTVGSFAIDVSGNLWITDTHAGSVIEWDSLGAALSPASGFPAGGGPIAIDATDNVWISGNGALYELTNLGSPLPWSPFGGISGGGQDLAIDAQSNIWIANPGGVNEFNGLGSQLSPVNGYTVDGVSNLTAIGIDSSNNVWLGTGPTAQNSTGQIAELTNPGGQLITSGGPGSPVPQMAADSAGDMWFAGGSQVCEAPPYGGKGSILDADRPVAISRAP